jgi:hypothetical protein
MELLAGEHGRPHEKRSPDAEGSRAGRVVDEFANKSFDSRAFENEDHRLLREKDAVPAKAGKSEPVGRALGKDLSSSLARAWHELPNDRHALIHIVINNPSFGASHRAAAPRRRPTDDGDCSNPRTRELTPG